MKQFQQKFGWLKLFGCALAAAAMLSVGISVAHGKAATVAASPASSWAAANAAAAAVPAPVPQNDKPDPALVDKGKQRYQVYRCFDCHGKNGEGTDDAPDLIGTHLDAAGIAKFLDKPSADAQAKGMPSVPAGSDDSKALVAFVLSIKKAR